MPTRPPLRSRLLMLSLTVTAAALAAISRPAGADNRPPLSLRGVRRIVTLGDSITQAGGAPGGYVTLLQSYLRALYPSQEIQIVNAGISGHKSTDMQARFQRDVLDKSPDLVTISVGVNDVWHAFRDFQAGVDHPRGDLPPGVPLPLYREKVAEMIRAAQERNVKVVLLAPTLIYENLDSVENQRLATYVAAMRDLAREHHCRFIDLNRAFREILGTYQKYGGRAVNLLTTDGVHMNAMGNRVMAYAILRGLGVVDRDIATLKS